MRIVSELLLNLQLNCIWIISELYLNFIWIAIEFIAELCLNCIWIAVEFKVDLCPNCIWITVEFEVDLYPNCIWFFILIGIDWYWLAATRNANRNFLNSAKNSQNRPQICPKSFQNRISDFWPILTISTSDFSFNFFL